MAKPMVQIPAKAFKIDDLLAIYEIQSRKVKNF